MSDPTVDYYTALLCSTHILLLLYRDLLIISLGAIVLIS